MIAGRVGRHVVLQRHRDIDQPARHDTYLRRWSVGASERHVEQPCCRASENVKFLVIAERRRCEDMVDGMKLPWIRIVAAEYDLTGSDLCRQVADRLR